MSPNSGGPSEPGGPGGPSGPGGPGGPSGPGGPDPNKPGGHSNAIKSPYQRDKKDCLQEIRDNLASYKSGERKSPFESPGNPGENGYKGMDHLAEDNPYRPGGPHNPFTGSVQPGERLGKQKWLARLNKKG